MAKIGYLKKDRQERFNAKHCWFVVAWRVVDESGNDLFQPWPKSKSEARKIAKALDINIVGEMDTQNRPTKY